MAVDSYLELYNAAAVPIATSDDDGRGFCSAIDGTGSNPFNPTAHNLPAGNYYLTVQSSPLADAAATLFDYRLSVVVPFSHFR